MDPVKNINKIARHLMAKTRARTDNFPTTFDQEYLALQAFPHFSAARPNVNPKRNTLITTKPTSRLVNDHKLHDVTTDRLTVNELFNKMKDLMDRGILCKVAGFDDYNQIADNVNCPQDTMSSPACNPHLDAEHPGSHPAHVDKPQRATGRPCEQSSSQKGLRESYRKRMPDLQENQSPASVPIQRLVSQAVRNPGIYLDQKERDDSRFLQSNNLSPIEDCSPTTANNDKWRASKVSKAEKPYSTSQPDTPQQDKDRSKQPRDLLLVSPKADMPKAPVAASSDNKPKEQQPSKSYTASTNATGGREDPMALLKRRQSPDKVVDIMKRKRCDDEDPGDDHCKRSRIFSSCQQKNVSEEREGEGSQSDPHALENTQHRFISFLGSFTGDCKNTMTFRYKEMEVRAQEVLTTQHSHISNFIKQMQQYNLCKLDKFCKTVAREFSRFETETQVLQNLEKETMDFWEAQTVKMNEFCTTLEQRIEEMNHKVNETMRKFRKKNK